MIRACPARPIVVLKVGGSLLSWAGLGPRLARLIDEIAARREAIVLIAGGGDVVEAIRALDRTHRMGEERSHALALLGMDLTAEILREIVGRTKAMVVEEPGALEEAWASGRVPILAPRRMLEDDDRTSREPLRHHWSVTSDTIAARMAQRLGASRLVLGKSTTLIESEGLHSAQASGLVDEAFPGAAEFGVPVVYLNLRDQHDAGRLLRMA